MILQQSSDSLVRWIRNHVYKFEKKYQENLGNIIKSYTFAIALEKGDKIADVAQLARARDL